MKNLAKKVKNYIKIDQSWFSYHIMMSQIYDPQNKTSQHVKSIIRYLNDVSKELCEEFPNITKNELIQETHYITSMDMIKYFEETSNYQKSLNSDIN